MLAEIEGRVEMAKKILESLNYHLGKVSAQDLIDYMSTETFTGDATTLNDILRNEYLLIHELVEINEWKRRGMKIYKRLLIDAPRTLVYTIHYTALEKELEYALQKGDRKWVEMRVKNSLEDPYIPEELKPYAKNILERFIKAIEDREKS
jgi:hypothetical protein